MIHLHWPVGKSRSREWFRFTELVSGKHGPLRKGVRKKLEREESKYSARGEGLLQRPGQGGREHFLNADSRFLHLLNIGANKFELVNTWKTEKNFPVPKPEGLLDFLPGPLDSPPPLSLVSASTLSINSFLPHSLRGRSPGIPSICNDPSILSGPLPPGPPWEHKHRHNLTGLPRGLGPMFLLL